MTIVEFLTARLDEDEAVARADFPVDFGVTDEDHDRYSAAVDLHKRQPHGSECAWRVGEGLEEACFCGYPARVLREVEAKRRIMRRHSPGSLYCRWSQDSNAVHEEGDAPCDDLRNLAAIYSAHEDFQEEWRP